MEDGFSIIELIIAISLLSFGIIGLYGFLYPAIMATSNSSFHIEADYLVQEAVEIVKNIRDNNIINGEMWSEGLVGCDSGCQLDYKTGTAAQSSFNELQSYADTFLNLNADNFYSYEPGIPTIFKRRVTITQAFAGNDDILKVDIVVTWDHNGNSFDSSVIRYIYAL